ncbi:MAG: GDP-mannose 4,6-dehydratase [Nitrososphaerota archaeon]|nr:GDP-mannose 4,6-dehydratase [Nitrososphaerota archaeon]MDG6972255.1 GDP-mannose 4,6-dehydratase [Nitrososphaerota archaeon]MDG6977369.1 GDP-mannose 4,6-dehydratase [Nitrososphaerota archaeon]MDG6979501.1 GDP-mannose 4,6-dehydratase [Nitrososphaerota archaeon]MDG6983750.1 GDP-mannose 4,6-dehydratase [Nitrososphaerota archaeon]
MELPASNGKRALVLGVGGQDGSYLAEILLSRGYEVHGLLRRSATGNTKNIDHLLTEEVAGKRFFTHKGDLADVTSIYSVIKEVAPDELYNEADQDHVSWSYATPSYSYDITGAAVGRVLEALRQADKDTRFFQPSSSNIFGKPVEVPQKETTAFNPQSPYACAKVMALLITRHYREAYGMFAANGILYNHESPRRNEEYVTRKITRAAAKIAAGLQSKISLGDIDIKIDWGYAKEYMEAAWNILQLPVADDFVIANGTTGSVREFATEAFSAVGLKFEDHLFIDKALLRPASTGLLVGDTSKAKKAFGFHPMVGFRDLARLMVESDVKSIGPARNRG